MCVPVTDSCKGLRPFSAFVPTFNLITGLITLAYVGCVAWSANFSPTVVMSELEESIRCLVHNKAAVLMCYNIFCPNIVLQSSFYVYQARALIIVTLLVRIPCTPIRFHWIAVSSQMGLLSVRYSCISVMWCLLPVIQWNFSWLKHNERTSQLVFLAAVAVSRSISLRTTFDTFTYGTHIILFGVRAAPVWISVTYSICHSKKLQRLVRGPWNGAEASRSFASCRYGAQVRENERERALLCYHVNRSYVAATYDHNYPLYVH